VAGILRNVTGYLPEINEKYHKSQLNVDYVYGLMGNMFGALNLSHLTEQITSKAM
jgi:hypothetical protein